MEIKDLINDNVAFHCDTKEKAREFINKAHALGYTWTYANKNTTFYEYYRENTCYTLNKKETRIGYSSIDYYKNDNYTIIEYELYKLTPIEYLMEYLGVKENELFNAIYKDGVRIMDCPYMFVGSDLYDCNKEICNELILNLANGSLTIEKLPWKPLHGDTVYYIDTAGIVQISSFYDYHLAMLKCGWLFRTKEEAEANRERVLKEYADVIGDRNGRLI